MKDLLDLVSANLIDQKADYLGKKSLFDAY
jgi:hypothetical protein